MMNKAEMRKVALSAARGRARKLGIDPEKVSAKRAFIILSDFPLIDRELVASQWYEQATDNQVTLFYREWNAWLHECRSRMPFPVVVVE